MDIFAISVRALMSYLQATVFQHLRDEATAHPPYAAVKKRGPRRKPARRCRRRVLRGCSSKRRARRAAIASVTLCVAHVGSYTTALQPFNTAGMIACSNVELLQTVRTCR